MNFANNLKQIRNKMGISQEELAERIGVRQSAIANYEAGTRYPRLDQVEGIAKALKTSIEDLLK